MNFIEDQCYINDLHWSLIHTGGCNFSDCPIPQWVTYSYWAQWWIVLCWNVQLINASLCITDWWSQYYQNFNISYLHLQKLNQFLRNVIYIYIQQPDKREKKLTKDCESDTVKTPYVKPERTLIIHSAKNIYHSS